MEQKDFWKVIQANTVKPCTNILYHSGTLWNARMANCRELFTGVNWKKRTTPCSSVFKLNGNNHRFKLHSKIFREFIDSVVDDVIKNDIQYHMVSGKRHYTIQTELCDNEYVSIIRNKGLMQEWDPFDSGCKFLILTLSNSNSVNKKRYLSLSNKNRINLINRSNSRVV